MAAFAVLFGTRHIDTTEHQHGLMLAIATESIVKLVAFLAVGIFVTFWMFDGPISMFAQALEMPATAALLQGQSSIGTLLAMTLLSIFAIVLLPRQFHVTVVENNNEAEIWRAAWLFPIYLILINLFVLPIALAGVMTFPAGRMDSDMFVLTLPLTAGSDLMTLVAFVGGLSAATAMVIVESVALSIMVSNDIVIPWVLKRKESLFAGRENMGAMLLMVRRAAIFFILFLAYMYYRMAGEAQLASIGLLSFAAIAQLAPAFFGGLIWRGATARGAVAGLSIGTLTWAYTLLLPSFADLGIIGQRLLMEGPGGFLLLRPQALLGVDLPPLLHGVLWSLSLNVLAYVAFSFTRAPALVERLQANLFVPSHNQLVVPTLRRWRSPVGVDELTKAVARYLGEERTRTAFREFCRQPAHRSCAGRGGGFPATALCRTSAGVRDRRGVLAPGADHPVAEARALHQPRTETFRRRQRRDPLQPRDLADRAGSCAPRHRGFRQGIGAYLLEPVFRRDSRPAGRYDPGRSRARGNPARKRRAAAMG